MFRLLYVISKVVFQMPAGRFGAAAEKAGEVYLMNISNASGDRGLLYIYP
jgi:hypothetical protein